MLRLHLYSLYVKKTCQDITFHLHSMGRQGRPCRNSQPTCFLSIASVMVRVSLAMACCRFCSISLCCMRALYTRSLLSSAASVFFLLLPAACCLGPSLHCWAGVGPSSGGGAVFFLGASCFLPDVVDDGAGGGPFLAAGAACMWV